MPFHPSIAFFPIHPRGVLARMTGADRSGGITAEIANALIGADFDRVAAIVAEEGPEILNTSRETLAKLLEDILVEIASDGRFEADERAYIQSFVKATAFPKSESRRIYALAMKRALGAAIDHAVIDGDLSDAEFERLKELAHRFDMSEADWKSLYTSTARERITASVNHFLEDGLFSDDEWGKTEALAKCLRVGIAFGASSEADVEYARDRWRAINGKLDVIAVPGVALQDDEGAYFDGECAWHELREVARRISYGNLTGSVRIAKGLRFRWGALRVTSPPIEEMQKVDSGRLILTSERLIFMGEKANMTIRWQAVLAVNIVSPNEFEVERTTGKSPTLAVTHGSRLFLVSSIAAGLIGRKYPS